LIQIRGQECPRHTGGPKLRDIFPGCLCFCRGDRSAAFAGDGGLYGHYVPEVFGNYVDHDEIYFVAGVGILPSGGFYAVAGLGEELGGFHLDAPEFASGIEDEVVALAVSPRLGDAEAEAGGFGEEGGLGDFSATLTGVEAYGLEVE